MRPTGSRFIKIVILVAVVTVSCCAADDAGQAAESDTGEDYLDVRESVEVAADPAMLSRSRSALSGEVLEVAGKVAGRSSVAGDEDVSVSFMLRVGEQTLFVDATRDREPIRVGNTVQALIELPPDRNPLGHFVLHAIAHVADLPRDVRLQVPKKADDSENADEAAPEDDQEEGRSSENGEPVDESGEQGTSERPDDTGSGDTASADRPPRPGTEYPDFEQMWPNQEDVRAWMDWVGEQNSELSEMARRVIAESVLHYADRFEVDHRLVFAMIEAESNFNPNCRSRSGALGLTQLMPKTAEHLGVSDPLDIQQNIMGGVRYLAEQLNIYSDKSPYKQCVLGLAAYNAGPNAVKRAGGIPDNGETPRYCQKVAELFYKLWKNDMP